MSDLPNNNSFKVVKILFLDNLRIIETNEEITFLKVLKNACNWYSTDFK
jgi:hypothetical protein